jgi:hypothetical protein
MRDGKSSTITEEQVKALEDIGFVRDSQGAVRENVLSTQGVPIDLHDVMFPTTTVL